MAVIEFFKRDLASLEGDLAKSLNYWKSLLGDRTMPPWSEFELLKIPHQILKTTHVTDINSDSGDYKVRFWGTGLVEVHQQELSQKWVSEMTPPALSGFVLKGIKQLRKERAPTAYSTTLESIGQPEILQTTLRLPLSDDGEQVTHAVTIVEFPQGMYYSREAYDKFMLAD